MTGGGYSDVGYKQRMYRKKQEASHHFVPLTVKDSGEALPDIADDGILLTS